MHLKHQRQLIQSGVLTEAQIIEAEEIAVSKKAPLLSALLELDSIDDEALLGALSKIYKTPYLDISQIRIDDALLEICPEKLCHT